MIAERILGVLVFAGLFVAFGLLNRRLGVGGCGGSCGGCAGEGEGFEKGGVGCSRSPDTGGEPHVHHDEHNPAGWWG